LRTRFLESDEKTLVDLGATRQLQQKLWQQQPCSGCWFNQSPATPDTALRTNSPLVCQVNTTLDASSTSSIVSFYETTANNVIGVYEYDFGTTPTLPATCPTTAPGGSLRSTQYAYWFSGNPSYGPPTASAPSNANLVNLPSYKIINGGSIDYYYYDQTTPLAATGTPLGHDDADFGTSYNTRGNLITHYVYQNETPSCQAAISSCPAETFTWDTTGRQLSYTDFNLHSTGYTFGDTPHVYPTVITNALNQARHYTYDPNILRIRTLTDENNASTQYSYNGDLLDRLTSVVRANGSETAWTYDPSNTKHVTFKQDQTTSGDGALQTDTYTDGLGRQTQSVVHENSSSTITTSTAWDTLGRVTSVSNPYRSGDNIYNTSYTYDALNRTHCVQASFDSAQTCTTYSGKTATVTDAANNTKTLVSDAAGRVTSVTEDPGSGTHLNYQTTYAYNVFDELTTVNQGLQTRTFGFDSRGRLGFATNPENGTTAYGYDSNNNLTSKTDNSGVATTYAYDALNRINAVTYSGPRTAPSVQYYYDTGAANAVGRLVSVWNSVGAAQQITAYDALGRIAGSTETLGWAPVGSFTYTYNLADALVSTTYPSGRVVTNTYDGANRINAVTGALNGSKTYISNATYAAFGGIGAFNYAVTNGVPAGTRTFSYNGRLQPGEMSDQGSSSMDLKYFYGGVATTGTPGASGVLNNGNPTGVVETAQKGSGTPHTFTQTYGYDSVNRLSAASDTGGWAQSFSFDQYGNPWQTTANTGLPPDRLPTYNVYTATTVSV
jgi:YD repeat-containing protein